MGQEGQVGQWHGDLVLQLVAISPGSSQERGGIPRQTTGKQWKLLPGAQTPMRATYQPEVDVSPELSAEFASYYQSLIGVLRCIVELSRVDICLEVLLLSSHLALPREGHFEQLLQDFSYLRKYHNSELIYDPSDPVIDEGQFQRRNWMSSELGHVNRKEEMPPKMAELRGQWVTIHAKVDVDHASDTVTRRSILIVCLCIGGVKSRQMSFGSEFIAMKQCRKYLQGLQYKLWMMGIPCEGPAYIYGDNQLVLAKSTMPDSTLKK